jgi:sulfur-oxidizing protein SoxZ
MSKPRVKLPKTARAGEVITIKTLISHEMESGHRLDAQGNRIPRDIINSFTCTFNGRPVFSCDMRPAISTNPYLEFTALVTEPGTFEFVWVDDAGKTYSTGRDIELA